MPHPVLGFPVPSPVAPQTSLSKMKKVGVRWLYFPRGHTAQPMSCRPIWVKCDWRQDGCAPQATPGAFPSSRTLDGQKIV